MSENYFSDLQLLAQKWGDKFSQHYGTTCKWIDLHATNRDMAQYQTYKIAAKVTNVRYNGNGTTADMPGLVVTDTTTNDTSLEQESQFKQTKSTTSSFTWTTMVGISVGISLSATVGVPEVASATTSLTTTISLESTASNTESETISWEIERSVKVPAHTKMDMVWTINQKRSNATFVADVILTGYIAIWNNDKIDVNNPGGSNKHWLWFFPINQVFNQTREWGGSVPSEYSIGSSSVTYKASGLYNGESGYDTTFTLKETPLSLTESLLSLTESPQLPRLCTEIAVPSDN